MTSEIFKLAVLSGKVEVGR